MPQFDTFSFFSQLSWVFLGFTFLYLSLCYYLLPAIAITLKVRKQKLTAQTSSDTAVVSSLSGSYLTGLNVALEKIAALSILQLPKESAPSLQNNKTGSIVIEAEAIQVLASDLSKKVTVTTIV